MATPDLTPDLTPVLDLLEAQRAEDLHAGAQVYVSRHGEVLLDTAVGESSDGRTLRTDDLMLWYSSGKPWTVVALLQLWEQGRLGLDDRIADHLDGWGNGKERATIRHVLTHTGGFPMFGDRTYDTDLPFDETLAATIATPAAWEPGTRAGYHPASGWRVLGGIVEQIDGRRIDAYVREEIAEPLGCTDCHMGLETDRQRAYGDRIVPVHWTGHRMPKIIDGALQMVPYEIDKVHNEPWHVAKVEPGGGMRGPANQLGRFYESLLGHGPRLLEPTTVELMGAVHRWGVKDHTFGIKIPWGLGVQVDFTGGTGRRAFGHGGMASSRGLADPETGLVMVVVANGLAGLEENERRNLDVTDAVYTALGDEVAPLRRSAAKSREALGFSS